MGTSLRTTYKQIILRVRVHTLHLRKQHMDGSKYKVVDAACVRSPEKPTCSGSLTHSVHSKGLNTSSCLSPNEPFACFPSEDEQINNKYNQHCVSSRLKGWQAEKICEGGKKKNHENRFPNTRVSYCTPTLWWSWSLWCCRGLYLHKARSKGCKDRDITIWCSNTVYKAGQYKVSEVSSLCLDEKNG